MNAKRQEQMEAIEQLKEMLKDGDTVYTVLRHVSGSGMYRHIQPVVIRDNEPLYLTWSVAHALKWPYKAKTHSIGVSGCGMDMGYDLVDNLGHALGIKLTHRWL